MLGVDHSSLSRLCAIQEFHSPIERKAASCTSSLWCRSPWRHSSVLIWWLFGLSRGRSFFAADRVLPRLLHCELRYRVYQVCHIDLSGRSYRLLSLNADGGAPIPKPGGGPCWLMAWTLLLESLDHQEALVAGGGPKPPGPPWGRKLHVGREASWRRETAYQPADWECGWPFGGNGGGKGMPLPPMEGIMGPLAPGFCMPNDGGGIPAKSQPLIHRASSREVSSPGKASWRRWRKRAARLLHHAWNRLAFCGVRRSNRIDDWLRFLVSDFCNRSEMHAVWHLFRLSYTYADSIPLRFSNDYDRCCEPFAQTWSRGWGTHRSSRKRT